MVRIADEPSQYKDYVRDLSEYPENEYSGEYKGIYWSMKRVLGHWNGYLHGLDLEQINKIEPSIHGGITYLAPGIIGFDCAHARDYSMGQLYEYSLESGNSIPFLALAPSYQTYKDYSWVKNHLYTLIDMLN